jgi:muramidase (phage lysozyme)
VDALQLIEAGQFDDAVMRARRIWASMPMAGYGQSEHSMDKWRDAFAQAGGVFT